MDSQSILGGGDFKYRLIPDWARLPGGWGLEQFVSRGDAGKAAGRAAKTRKDGMKSHDDELDRDISRRGAALAVRRDRTFHDRLLLRPA